MKLKELLGQAQPPAVYRFSKKELERKITHLQLVCEFLIEQIQPENADGLEVVPADEDIIKFSWKKKEEPS